MRPILNLLGTLHCSVCLQVVEKPLPYDTVRQVRQRLAEVAPHFARFDHVEQPLWLNGEYFKVRRRSTVLLACLWGHQRGISVHWV